MGLKNSQYQAIMRKYEQKQLRNHDILTQHYEEVYRQLPEFKSLDDSISILSVQYGKRLLNGDQKAISSLKEELAILRASKQELLRSSGFPADYLEPVYDCPNCKDTGYIGNQKCHCFKKAIIDLLYEQSNLKEILKKENFSNFALDYYSTNFIDPKTGRSSRQVIEDALRICRNFVTSFGTDFQNLFLYGDVGVGKTFLSNCIAKELMDKEYSVLYFSASKFFSSLAKHASLMIWEPNIRTILLHPSSSHASTNDCLTAVLQLYQQTCHWTLWLIFIQNGPFPESQVIISC